MRRAAETLDQTISVRPPLRSDPRYMRPGGAVIRKSSALRRRSGSEQSRRALPRRHVVPDDLALRIDGRPLLDRAPDLPGAPRASSPCLTLALENPEPRLWAELTSSIRDRILDAAVVRRLPYARAEAALGLDAIQGLWAKMTMQKYAGCLNIIMCRLKSGEVDLNQVMSRNFLLELEMQIGIVQNDHPPGRRYFAACTEQS